MSCIMVHPLTLAHDPQKIAANYCGYPTSLSGHVLGANPLRLARVPLITQVTKTRQTASEQRALRNEARNSNNNKQYARALEATRLQRASRAPDLFRQRGNAHSASPEFLRQSPTRPYTRSTPPDLHTSISSSASPELLRQRGNTLAAHLQTSRA